MAADQVNSPDGHRSNDEELKQYLGSIDRHGTRHGQTRTRSSSSSSLSSLSSIFEDALSSVFSVLPVAQSAKSSDVPVVYSSTRFGDISLFLPDTSSESERQLQAHLLWPAGVRMARDIENGSIDVVNESVVELGAGAALPSIIAAKCGAARVAITDYPADSILAAVRKNVQGSLSQSSGDKRVSVHGLDWSNSGSVVQDLLSECPTGFTRVLIADTLWMSHLHEDQLDVILALLSSAPHSRVHVKAGLHSGRPCVRHFLICAIVKGFEIESAQEVERSSVSQSPDSSSRGSCKDWPTDESTLRQVHAAQLLDEELEVDRRRWLFQAVLRRK